jgi:hypothetical protein
MPYKGKWRNMHMNKKVYIIIIGLFFLGVVVGAARWVALYTTYVDTFSGAPIAQQRKVLATMLAKQSPPAVLHFLRFIYPNEEPITHGIGHLLGEELYRIYGAYAFGTCDAIFNYGCFHGVVDMAIKLNGIQRSLVDTLYEACEKTMNDPSACIHPLGHASVIVTRYNALDAFALCDKLYPEPKVAFSCWNGVMMEYINRASPTAPSAVYGDPNNPQSPCDRLPKKYESSCVSQHTSYLWSIWEGDTNKLLRFCSQYREETMIACVDAVGAHIAQDNFDDNEAIVAACGYIPANRDTCLQGAVVPLAVAGKRISARVLCDHMSGPAQKDVCVRRLDIQPSIQ